MHALKAVIPYMARYRRKLIYGSVAVLCATLLALTQPYLLGRAIDDLKQGRPQSEVLVIAGLIVLVALLQGIGEFFSRYTISEVSRRVEYDLRNDLFAHLQTMQQSFFQDMRTGDLMARATNDLTAVRAFLGPGITNSIRTTFMFVIAAALMINLNLELALILLFFMPLVSLSFVLIGSRLHDRFERVQAQFGDLSTYAQENFSGIRVIKAYAQEEYEVEHFSEVSRKYLKHSLSYQRLNQLLWPLLSAVIGLVLAGILYVGGNDVISGKLSLGQFVQFLGYLAMLSWPMIALGWVVNLYQQGAASMGRIRTVMTQMPRIVDNEQTVPMQSIRGDIRFDHVSLTYDKRKVLDDVTFHAPAGSTLAIVGATGAGKTSIVNLLVRAYEAQQGRVLVDNMDVRRIPLALLRRNIGYVPQDTFLFSTSLVENIAFGLEQIEPALVAQAVETSRLSNDLDQFPEGVGTVIGERGVTLSGGQKQRTALARAIARDPAILILDDSLSSIDTQTQSQILAGLREVMRGRTSVIISQRISTVKEADQILVLDNNHIAECGTHTELVAQRGIYASMYRRELLTKELGIAD